MAVNRSIFLQNRFLVAGSACIWILCITAVQGTTCFKEESLGDRDGNVYYCEEETKPECCEQDQQYTCCESQSTRTWKEQAILWGSVGGLVLLITLLCCYFWRDNACTRSDRSLAQRCCTCCNKTEPEDKRHLAARPGTSKSFSPNKPWRFGGQGMANDDRDSPAPAFHFKQSSYRKY